MVKQTSKFSRRNIYTPICGLFSAASFTAQTTQAQIRTILDCVEIERGGGAPTNQIVNLLTDSAAETQTDEMRGNFL